MNPSTWIVSGDTGISSKTIWAVMMGADTSGPVGFRFDTPYDPGDFGRCYRLLHLIPEWRHRLPEVADRFPEWGPLVRAWSELEDLYRDELPTGQCPKLYERMKVLIDEGRLEAGWEMTGPGCWIRPKRAAGVSQ